MSRLLSVYTPTPTGVAIFPKEIFRPPRSWVAAKYNVVQWSEFPKGGHFAALEQPADLAPDVARFATKVWKDHLQQKRARPPSASPTRKR
jgi:pimeloyl-ACP methyl ester carboxylesterase